MPSINDRIGSQNVIRVLSNASAPPSKLLNLTDVESTSQTDGNLLIWDADISKFVMGRDLDGTEGYVFTGGTGQVGIVTFSGTTQSESTTTGAVIISGGLAVGKNVNFAAGLNVVGIATFSNEIDINAAVDILRGLNVAGVTSVASLNIGATQVISSGRELQNIASLDATTTATIEAAIEVAPNTFTDLKISGVSTFIGIATYAAGIQVVSGVSTFDVAVDINAGLDVDGQTDLDEVVIAGVTTFNNADVVFQGAAAGQNITFDASENDLEFTDNARIKFGNNDDLEIWHDGTNSNIKNSTGDFHIRGDSLALKTADNSERYLKATKNEDVKLYYNGNEKFATTAEGVDITGRTETDLLNVSGVSTFAGLIDANARLDVVGGANLDQLNVAGITTLGAVDINGIIDIDGQLDVDELVVAGVSTFNSAVDIDAGLDVDGQTDLDELVVAGVSTFSNAVDINSTLDVDGDTQVDDLNVAGVATFSSLVDANNRLDVVGGANLDQLNVSGITTLGAVDINGIIDIDGQLDVDELVVVGVSTFSSAVDINAGLDIDGQLDADELVVAGVATFSSLIDANNRLDVVGGANLDQLNVTGVSTLTGNVSFGTSAFFGDNDKINMGDGNDLQIYHASNGTGIIQNAGSGQLQLRSDTIRLLNQATDEDFAFFRDDGAVELYYNNTKRFETSGIGITVTGQLDSTTLNVSGVSTFSSAVDINAGLDVDGDTQVDDLNVAGVATFSSLVDANNRLDVVGGANLDQLNVVGIATFTTIDANGGLDIDGQLDVDELVVAGVSTFLNAVDINSTLDVDGDTQVDDLNVAGVATFSSLIDANNRLDVVGGANLDQLNVAGVSTFGNVSIFNDDVRITAGGLNVVGVATFSTNVNVTGTLDAGLIDGGTY